MIPAIKSWLKMEASSPLLLVPTVRKHRHSTTSQDRTTSQAPDVQTHKPSGRAGGISHSDLNRSLGIVCVVVLSYQKGH